MFRKSIALLLYLVFLTAPDAHSVPSASLELYGKVIILDAGHGVSTTNTYAGYDEQVTMLKLALRIKPLLESRGATVYLTRASGEGVLLSVRTAMINILALKEIRDMHLRGNVDTGGASVDINEINRLLRTMQSIIDDPEMNGSIYMNSPYTPERRIHPELKRIFQYESDPQVGDRFLVISLHSNATAIPINTAVNGASVFHVSNTHTSTSNYYNGYSYEEQSRRFGNILLDHIDAVGIRRRELTGANYFLIREHNLPGVLVENGFHTNDTDRANLSSSSFLDSLALAYLDAITGYFHSQP